MKKTSALFLAEACGGALTGNKDAWIRGVKIDSRELCPGEMFVAVVGDVNDGHDYLEGAYDLGCRVFLVSDRTKALPILEKDPQVCLIFTENTMKAFKDMAEKYLAQFSVKKIAVTGSVGKTSTRNLTAAVLGARYKVVCARKNLNTYLGIAMTAFDVDDDTQAVVFEMGMDRRREIESYVDWVRPNTAVITNIGIIHLEYLGTRDEIALEKLSITKNLQPSEYLVYQYGTDYLTSDDAMRHFAMGKDFLSFPVGKEDSLRTASVVDKGAEGIEFDLLYKGSSVHCSLPIMGVHNAQNAAFAAAVGIIHGLSLKEIARGLSSVSAESRRLNVVKAGGVDIIDDTYNAGPQSMMAALDLLKQYKAKRRIAVLGIMRELGSEAENSHLAVGRHIADCGIDLLVTIGEMGKLYVKEAEKDKKLVCISFNDTSMAEEFVKGQLKPGDAVLLKGSNITGVAVIATHLREYFSGR